MISPGEEARARGPVGVEWGPGRQAVAEPGALLRGDSQAGKGRNALTFFWEVNKVREYGWDPVYLTLAPQGTWRQCRTTHWNRTSQTSGARGPVGRPGEGKGPGTQPRPLESWWVPETKSRFESQLLTLSRSLEPQFPLFLMG